MRGAFDDRQPVLARPQRDAELTLGPGKLLAIFFGLVVLCGLFFGLGYTVGHRSSQEPAEALMPSQPADSPQEAPQAAASSSKPAASGASSALPAAAADPADGQADDPDAPSTPDPEKAAGSSPSAPPSSKPAQAPPAQAPPAQIRLATPQPPANPPPSAQPSQGMSSAPRVQPAMAPPVSVMVQVAMVSHPEDAAVLVNALRKRGYTVTAQRKPEDGLIHVWIGPFSSRDEAERWRLKLLNDGYNAKVEP